ncbi:MAG TPA: hypothetical protein VNC21_17750 [Vicinamibacterales bacterium]|nr:hypothetical protein [Vicinamibacterales bacterium]
MRRTFTLGLLAIALCASGAALAQAPVPKAVAPTTDLDRFMATALQRRDIDRKTLSDYVLDEVEAFEVLGPGKVPFARMRREYTWYVRDGIHVRSPLKFDGVPIPESERRAYEEKWIHSEENRRKFRTERIEKRAQEGKPPAVSVPSVNEPRFISESYFMDFKFEPGNYYLAGKETLDGHEVLKIDYLPTRLFNDEDDHADHDHKADEADKADKGGKPVQEKPDKRSAKEKEKEKDKEQRAEEDIDRKMNKTAQVTLWVDPASHQIVKYTFDNVWMDFLPAGWLVHIDDLRASMQMGQPFPDVWLPRNVSIHGGVSFALGPMELSYKREFSNYRKADVSSKVTVPKKVLQ